METPRCKGTSESPTKPTNAVTKGEQQYSMTPALPYPEYSILEDGSAGKFKAQILDQPGRDRLYTGWVLISLQTCPGSDVTLNALFDHLHSSLTPPPGIPLLKDPEGLIPHLTQYRILASPTHQNGTRCDSSAALPSNAATLVIKDAALRHPSFEETSEVWKSVGMSLMRWALLAMGKVGGSLPGQTTASSDPGNGMSTSEPDTAGPSATSARLDELSTPTSPEREEVSQASGHDNGLPDSTFTVSHSSLLPYPEISLRRSIAVTDKEKSDTSTLSTLESAAAMAEMETQEAGKNKKKAFWARQTVGPEGSRAVAMAWLRAATVEKPAENHYTIIESAYHLYRAYGHHPFQCPPLDAEAFTRLVADGSSGGSRQGWTGEPWYEVTDEFGLAGHPIPQTGSLNPLSKLPTLMRTTLKSPETMLIKEHENIWESVGMSWKKARTYEWNESKLADAREKDAIAKAAKGEEKRRRVLKSLECQPEANGHAPDHRPKTRTTPKMASGGDMPPPVPRSSPHASGPRYLQRMEPQVPRTPDFVFKWFTNTFRRAPPVAQIAQRDMWQAYSALVQTQSARYERDLARFFAIRQGLIERKEFETLRLEGERLSQVHRMLDYYVALKPAELFHLVIHRFGCTLGRSPGGEYTLDGLEATPIPHFM